ncbi:MAG: cell division protein DedD [Pseudohongiella sp.]|nr:MAG: cell division protein DedD [Pseudohongiella sp.]
MDDATRQEIEAATFRRLLQHLDDNKDVQNIDLMNLASFCRNCLSKWYVAEAESRGSDIDYESAREIVYGMPYSDWKAKYQSEATAEQLEKFTSR